MLRQITKTILLLLIIFTAFNAKAQQSAPQITGITHKFWLNSASAVGSRAYTRNFRRYDVPKGAVAVIYRAIVSKKEVIKNTSLADIAISLGSTAVKQNDYAKIVDFAAKAIGNSDGAFVDFFIFSDTQNAEIFLNGKGQSDNIFKCDKSNYKTMSLSEFIKIDANSGSTLYFGFRNNNLGGWGTGGLQVDFEVIALFGQNKNSGWTQENLNLFKVGLMKQPDINSLPEKDRLSDLIVYATTQKYTFEQLSQSKAQDDVELGYKEIVLNAKKQIAGEKEQDKKEALNLYGEAAKLIQQKKYSAALQMSEYVISKGQKNNITLNLHGYCLLLTKQFTKAKKILKEANLLDPTDLYVQGNLASAYLLTNEFENAKAIYLQYANENIDANTSFKQVVKEDFELFKQIGIVSLDFQKIYDLIGIK